MKALPIGLNSRPANRVVNGQKRKWNAYYKLQCMYFSSSSLCLLYRPEMYLSKYKITSQYKDKEPAPPPPPTLEQYPLFLLVTTFKRLYCTYIHVVYTDTKEKKIFLIYKEIQMGAVAKLSMRKGFLINEEMRKYFAIYV
jgi:hypothetical protein